MTFGLDKGAHSSDFITDYGRIVEGGVRVHVRSWTSELRPPGRGPPLRTPKSEPPCVVKVSPDFWPVSRSMSRLPLLCPDDDVMLERGRDRNQLRVHDH